MSDVKFSSWMAAESPVTVEYSLVVIEEIRHEVAEGFQKLSRGGVEVGGVLYGTQDGANIKVTAIRPIACEHARGPSFILSDKDKNDLAEQLRRGSDDPRLEGLSCLGWYLSHTRSDILLTDSDQEIYSTYFAAPWQVTLVIRPGRGGSMRAGFFVRELDGSVKSDRSYLEFNFPDRLAGVLDRPPRTERMSGERRQAWAPRLESGAAAAPMLRQMPQPLQPDWAGPELLPAPPPRARWPWLIAGAMLVIAAALIGVRYFPLASRTDPIALTVTERQGQLQIEWNRDARPVVAATRGSLAIVDGNDTRTILLSPEDLARGNVAYQRNSGDVEVRLGVENSSGNKIEEASRFLGRPPVKVDSEELKALQEERDQLNAEVQRLRQENSAENERIQQLDRTLRILQARLGNQ